MKFPLSKLHGIIEEWMTNNANKQVHFTAVSLWCLSVSDGWQEKDVGNPKSFHRAATEWQCSCWWHRDYACFPLFMIEGLSVFIYAALIVPAGWWNQLIAGVYWPAKGWRVASSERSWLFQLKTVMAVKPLRGRKIFWTTAVLIASPFFGNRSAQSWVTQSCSSPYPVVPM